MAKPVYEACSGRTVGEKTYWTRVGAVFPAKSGNGLTLRLDAIPAPRDGAYFIALFPPKDKDDGPDLGS